MASDFFDCFRMYIYGVFLSFNNRRYLASGCLTVHKSESLYNHRFYEIWYVGRLFVKGTGKPTEIHLKLNELAGLEHSEEMELFEELQFKPKIICEHVDKKLTFQESGLEDGDIICFQKVVNVENSGTLRCPDVQSFLEYVQYRKNLETYGKPIRIYN